MKGDGVPCVGKCGKWVEHDQYVCPVCKEDRFCSAECFWAAVPQCPEYFEQKDRIPVWTSRSVVDRLFARIRQDVNMMKELGNKLENRQRHMIVFTIHDEDMLAQLLSSNEQWKDTIVENCESRPSFSLCESTLTFPFAIYCIKSKSLDCRLL